MASINTERGNMTRARFLGNAGRSLGAIVIGGAAAAEFVAGCGGSSSKASLGSGGKSGKSTSTVKFQESWLNNVEFAGIYAAAKQGYFADAGINVNVMPGGTTVDPRSVVANGAALIGSVAEGTDVVLAIAQGAPIKAIAAQYQQNPGCLMVKANSGITSVADLKGKSIGLQNDARQQVDAILSHNNLSPGDVNLVTVGNDTTPFVLGKVDAYTAFAFDEPIALAEKGIKTSCMSYSKIGLPAYGDVYIAQTSTIEKEASMLAGFVHAAQRGWQYAIDNSHEVVAMTLADFGKGQAPKQQAAQMQVEIPMLQSEATKAHGLLWMTSDVWQSSLSFMSQAKLIKKPVSVSDVMTQEILNRAGK